LRIQALQHAVQILAAANGRAGLEALTQFFGAGRSGEQAVEQRAEIEAGASDDDGQVFALPNLG
jgi:hypothetical protein